MNNETSYQGHFIALLNYLIWLNYSVQPCRDSRVYSTQYSTLKRATIALNRTHECIRSFHKNKNALYPSPHRTASINTTTTTTTPPSSRTLFTITFYCATINANNTTHTCVNCTSARESTIKVRAHSCLMQKCKSYLLYY